MRGLNHGKKKSPKKSPCPASWGSRAAPKLFAPVPGRYDWGDHVKRQLYVPKVPTYLVHATLSANRRQPANVKWSPTLEFDPAPLSTECRPQQYQILRNGTLAPIRRPNPCKTTHFVAFRGPVTTRQAMTTWTFSLMGTSTRTQPSQLIRMQLSGKRYKHSWTRRTNNNWNCAVWPQMK